MRHIFGDNGEWTPEATMLVHLCEEALKPIARSAIEAGVHPRDLEYILGSAANMVGCMTTCRARREAKTKT